MIAKIDTPFRPCLNLMQCSTNHSDDYIHSVINYVVDYGSHRLRHVLSTFHQYFHGRISKSSETDYISCHSHLLGRPLMKNKFGNSGFAKK
jgi:hypothetical protein